MSQRVAILEEGRPPSVTSAPRAPVDRGDVYKGVVSNVLPVMEASFVEIGLPKNGFLYVDEMSSRSSRGSATDAHPRISSSAAPGSARPSGQDPMGTKGAAHHGISLSGPVPRYTPFGDGIGISRRLEDSRARPPRGHLETLDDR